MISELNDRIRQGQAVIKVGDFRVRVASTIPSVIDGVSRLYQDYPLLPAESFADYFVRIYQPVSWRRIWRKQVLFAFDQFRPFKPLPYSQALPFFEWGFNWCISGYAHQYLIIHAAVIEKNDKAVILPGFPGSGKSTLCAALVNSGWRLLSDELTLVDCNSGKISPVPRPVSLKNESIPLIQEMFPDALFTETVHDTLKGSVSLMKAPRSSILDMDKTVKASQVIFPSFQKGSHLSLTAMKKAEAFMQLADLSFNYPVLGQQGFNVLGRLIQQVDCYHFCYDGDLIRAVAYFNEL